MENFQKNIDKLVSKILNEEIESRVKHISETKGQWEEIEMDENLSGRQSKIDVAEPKGKITAADFKKLRDAKAHKKEVEEYYFDNSDDESVEDAEELSQDEPTYVGKGLADNKIKNKIRNKMFGSFDDEHGWFDQSDRKHSGDFDFDYDEEEFEDFPSLMVKHGKNQRWFAPNDGEKFFNQYQQHFGGKPFRVRTKKSEMDENIFKKMFGKKEKPEVNVSNSKKHPSFFDLGWEYNDIVGWHSPDNPQGGRPPSDEEIEKYHKDREDREIEEAETEEGNAFTGALAKAKDSGKDSFEVDGKEYNVNESDDKFIQKANMKKGALHKALGIPESQKISKTKLNSIKKDLMSKAKGDKKLSAADSKLLKQVNMALTLGNINENKNSLSLTENELIDMIENIVKEQMVKDPSEKNNFGVNKPQGLKKTEKAQGESQKENDKYAKEVVKKMKDYMKDMYMGGKGYDENPDDFPQSNYDMEKEHNEMKYHPSDAVEEYIEAFSYPGMTNLVYDEIKPDDEMITKQIKGDSKNGNAITGKDGKALGNVSKRSEKVGDRFKKNFDENLYGAEQMNGTYKKTIAPVDIAGNKKQSGSLKSIKGSSTSKANKIMNQLESTEDKATKIIKEDLQKMKNLISYSRKTQ